MIMSLGELVRYSIERKKEEWFFLNNTTSYKKAIYAHLDRTEILITARGVKTLLYTRETTRRGFILKGELDVPMFELLEKKFNGEVFTVSESPAEIRVLRDRIVTAKIPLR